MCLATCGFPAPAVPPHLPPEECTIAAIRVVAITLLGSSLYLNSVAVPGGLVEGSTHRSVIRVKGQELHLIADAELQLPALPAAAAFASGR